MVLTQMFLGTSIVFMAIVLLSSIMVIISRDPVKALLYLVLVFINSVVLFVLLDAEFIGLLYLVVYVGAIIVLLLFVVMMLNVKVIELKESVSRYVVVFCFLAWVWILFITKVVFATGSFVDYYVCVAGEVVKSVTFKDWALVIGDMDQTAVLGILLYSYFGIVFVLIGVLLLIAMVVVIALTLHFNESVKRQDLYKQLSSDMTLRLGKENASIR